MSCSELSLSKRTEILSPGLSPQPVVGPGVRVAVRVDDGDDEPVEPVDELLLPRDVLGQLAHHVGHHRRADPLPRVNPCD